MGIQEDLEYNYLMLVGGSCEDVEACIEYIKGLRFGEVVPLSCTGKDNETLKKEINEFIRYKGHINNIPSGLTGTLLRRIARKRNIFSKELKEYKEHERIFEEYKLLILKNISGANENVWHDLVEVYDKSKPGFLIATVSSKKEFDKLPETWRNLFEINFLDSKDEKTKKRNQRISDTKFKQLCKEVEREYCTRAEGEMVFFGKLSEVSKLIKYDKTGRGYKTWQSAKKRFYEVFPSK